MSQINWSPETPVHTGHLNAPPKATVARLVVGGVPQPHTEVPGHTPLSLQIGVPVEAEPPPPPASDWPEFALHPNELVRPGSDLEHYLRAHQHEENTIIIDEDSIGKLNELAQRSDPAILGNHVFTTYGDDFGLLPLTVNFGGDTGEKIPTFQGFRMVPANGSGICARHYGKGRVVYRLSNFVNAYKGIASTSKDADIHLFAQYCIFDAMSGSQCAAMYGVRGSINSRESVITNIGHRPSERRGSDAYLNHAFYAHLECEVNIVNTFARTIDSHAVNARKGGVIDGLLANRTANGIGFGHKTDRPIVDASIERAIVVNTEDVDPETRRTGVGIGGERARIRVSNSTIAYEESIGVGSAFRFYNDCQITLGENVRVQGMPRVVDVTGHRAAMTGTVHTPGYSMLVNSRPEFSASGVNLTATNARPLTLPDFDKLPTPKPGYVGRLIDSILGGV